MLFESQILAFLHHLPSWRKREYKKEIRNMLQEKRRILTPEQIEEYSSAIVERVQSLPEFVKAKTILAYYPIKYEVNVRPLLNDYMDKKLILLPAVMSRGRMEVRQYEGRGNLRRGSYGIPEPQGAAYKGKIDLVIVPGVGFDAQLHRIGRGGGYYDKFLSAHKHAIKVAVAFDFQVIKDVPVDSGDREMDIIVTPTRVLR